MIVSGPNFKAQLESLNGKWTSACTSVGLAINLV